MLPVVGGTTTTTRHILVYTAQLVAVTLLLYPPVRWARSTSAPPPCSARGSRGARSVSTGRRRASAMRLFKYSINYLALLFAAVAVDSLVR